MHKLNKKITLAEARKLADSGCFITIVMSVNLSDLVNADGVEGLNEIVDERLSDDFTLVEISYRVIGCEIGDGKGIASGSVSLEVTGQIDALFEDE